MKKLNTLLRDSQIGHATDGASAPVKQAELNDSKTSGNEDGRDHVDAINQMFAEFELAYHNQFHKAYAREGSLAMAKKYWLSCLQAYPPRLLLRATREVVGSQEYLPTLSNIMKACERGGELFGLPNVRAAYIEACLAPSHKQSCRWSHAAVYLAGRDTNWYVLASEPESVSLPLFEYHYLQYCRRVMAGDQLQVPNPPALTDDAGRELDADENRTRLANLRKSLNL